MTDQSDANRFVIELVGLASAPYIPKKGPTKYLKGYDPDGDPPGLMPYRTGMAEWTTNLDEALVFNSHDAAVIFWKQEHPDEPTRPDGRPNRPLTAYTIIVSPLYLARGTAPI